MMKKEVKKQDLKRLGIYPLSDVLPFIVCGPVESNKKRPIREYGSKQVKMDSLRYQTFLKGTKCVACNLEGQYFALEQHNYLSPNQSSTRWHLNLYGVNSDGDEVLLTKDHIRPRSLGGGNALDNLQTMCYPCNHNKGNGKQQPDQKKLRRIRFLTKKVGRQLHRCRKQRKTVYDGSCGDGGPLYLALKARQSVLVARLKLLKKIKSRTKYTKDKVGSKNL